MSHDREFLDQLCTKIVETEFGKATTYKGNYTQYVNAKQEKMAQQWSAYEKQQKEIARQVWSVVSCSGKSSPCLGCLSTCNVGTILWSNFCRNMAAKAFGGTSSRHKDRGGVGVQGY